MALIEEVIFNGFLSQVMNDIVDISKDKVKTAVKNKNAKQQNMESQIYNITIDVLNKITNGQYENNQDDIYDAAEKLLKSCIRNECNKIRNIKSCLEIFISNVDENKCFELQKIFFEELGKDEYRELYHAILLVLLERKNQYDYTVNEQLGQQLNSVEKKIDQLSENLNGRKNGSDCTAIQDNMVKDQNNKKQVYIHNWKKRLFLHIDNAENPITLADSFIIPNFKIRKFIKKIKLSFKENLDVVLEKFVEYDKTSSMLITGAPGIGKTSITAWMTNKYQNDDRIMVLRFRDWKKEELEKGLLRSICGTLACRQEDLENKILILDGFDEMKPLNIRERILEDFFNEILDLENFKCIITSRPFYVDSKSFENVIELLPFNISKIKSFYQKITGEELDEKDKKLDNVEVLGIPVILYMAIMSGVNIRESSSIPDLYNRIFAEKGGIFDRFCDDGIGYDGGAHLLRNGNNIKAYLHFLQELAFKMFENKGDPLSKKHCNFPRLAYQGKDISILEFPIKNFFENTDNSIEFIHRTIYEYFLSEYIYTLIHQSIDESTKDFSVMLCELFKTGMLSKEIVEFLKFRFYKSKDLQPLSDIVNQSFQLMLQKGMTYYHPKNIQKNNIVESEMRIFTNTLELRHAIGDYHINIGKLLNVYLRYNSQSFLKLDGENLRALDLCYARLNKADLKGAQMEGCTLVEAHLFAADLEQANLTRADLRGADLESSNLKEAKLSGANLERARFIDAVLTGIDLDHAKLKGAIFDDSQIADLEKNYNLTGTKVYINATQEIISYKEYRK